MFSVLNFVHFKSLSLGKELIKEHIPVFFICARIFASNRYDKQFRKHFTTKYRCALIQIPLY